MQFAVTKWSYAEKSKSYLSVHLPICNVTAAPNYTSVFKLLENTTWNVINCESGGAPLMEDICCCVKLIPIQNVLKLHSPHNHMIKYG